MAKKVNMLAGDFSIQDPTLGTVKADKNQQVLVSVSNDDGQPRTFVATVAGIGISADDGGGSALGQEGTSEIFSACVSVPNVNKNPTGNNNNTVKVVGTKISDGTKNDHSVSFEAVSGGPDCHSSGSVASASASASGSKFVSSYPAALAKAGNPVPVALSLQVEAPAGAGDPDADHLNRPTTLRFSNSSAEECCWLSQPVDACSDRSSPAFWMLRTGDARTWILILRRGDADVAVYHLTTPATKGTPFPLRMRLSGGGRAWPQAVTVSPAP